MLSRTLLANSSWYRCLCTKATLRRSIPFCASYSHRRDMHEETKIKIPDFSQEFKGMDPSFPCLTEQAPRWGRIYHCSNNNFNSSNVTKWYNLRLFLFSSTVIFFQDQLKRDKSANQFSHDENAHPCYYFYLTHLIWLSKQIGSINLKETVFHPTQIWLIWIPRFSIFSMASFNLSVKIHFTQQW